MVTTSKQSLLLSLGILTELVQSLRLVSGILVLRVMAPTSRGPTAALVKTVGMFSFWTVAISLRMAWVSGRLLASRLTRALVIAKLQVPVQHRKVLRAAISSCRLGGTAAARLVTYLRSRLSLRTQVVVPVSKILVRLGDRVTKVL